jgi:hypothetical protein
VCLGGYAQPCDVVDLLCHWQARSSIINEARKRPILHVGKPYISCLASAVYGRGMRPLVLPLVVRGRGRPLISQPSFPILGMNSHANPSSHLLSRWPYWSITHSAAPPPSRTPRTRTLLVSTSTLIESSTSSLSSGCHVHPKTSGHGR